MRATLRIDPQRRIGAIDRRIYGHFIEHLGRCIYGGVFDPGSPLADERGFRRDVLDAARRLRVPQLRWPGGNFASSYDWRHGVGPAEGRPARPDLAWRAVEPNTFGTNEFIAYCRALDAQPYVCLNMGDGTMREALGWLEYCNGAQATSYAQLRRSHGHDAPHDVMLWGLGNEVYGQWQIGHKNAADYAEQAREWGKVLKLRDPRIELVAVGYEDQAWNREVLTKARRVIDHISIHFYFRPERGGDTFYSLLARTDEAERHIRALARTIAEVRQEKRHERDIGIAVDEWNVWYRTVDDLGDPPLEEVYDLTDALAVASFLNVLRRNAATVRLANLAQMVNVIAPIMTRPDDVLLQTIYWPLLDAVEHGGVVALDASCESETFAKGSPYVDASVTLDEASRTLFVHAVNRHRDDTCELRLRIDGATPAAEGVRHTVTADDVSAANTWDGPERVVLRSGALTGLSNDCVIDLAPHSANTLELRLS